jgi:ABC-type transporter Mla maintaining outer membrane lipid asymmetry ATPase subunit MlaF
MIEGEGRAMALETKGLTLSYGNEIIIDQLGLEIPKSKITVFINAVYLNGKFKLG